MRAAPQHADRDSRRPHDHVFGDRRSMSWFARARSCRLFAYRLPTEPFRPHHEVGGFWVHDQTVEAVERIEVGDLLERHTEPVIELRVTRRSGRSGVASTLAFSGSRLRNAIPHPDQHAS